MERINAGWSVREGFIRMRKATNIISIVLILE